METYEIIKLAAEHYHKCQNIWDMNKQATQAEKWLKEIVSGNRMVYVYTVNGDYIAEGALVLENGDSDYTLANRRIYLSRMIVKPDYRNQGIGGIILDYLINVAENLGYSEMSLGVDKTNLNARHLYLKKGFNEVIFDGEDDMGEYQKLLKYLTPGLPPEVSFPQSVPPDVPMIFVVIIAKLADKLVLVKHRKRTTFEIPGGHIEAGETPHQAAKRELYEETGAVDFDLELITPYMVAADNSTRGGYLFFADIKTLGELPPFEIERVALFKNLPPNYQLTYPQIQPKLYRHFLEWDKN